MTEPHPDVLALADKTTAEVALLCGVPPYALRKWSNRGDLPHAPRGVSGQGRGNELLWSPEAVQEALARSKEVRGHDYRRDHLKGSDDAE